MAIFIVDQFSLNTDLPLDIRYVPAGGSYLDISAYWYPGMQVYQTSDQKIWYADNSLNWQQMGTGGSQDGSINELYNFFNDLSTYAHSKFADVDASIVSLRGWQVDQDASIVSLRGWQIDQDASITEIRSHLLDTDASFAAIRAKDIDQDASIVSLRGWQIDQDASIVSLRTDIIDVSSRVYDLDASVVLFKGWQVDQDASIVAIRTHLTDTDASFADIRSKDLDQDASIVVLRGWQIDQDASIVVIRTHLADTDASFADIRSKDLDQDASIVLLKGWQVDQDASIVGIRNNIETSLGLFVKKAGDTMSGPLVITAGGLDVTGDVSVTGNQFITKNLTIGGDLTVDGSVTYINSTTLDISTNLIRLNTGLTGVPPITLQSGVVVERGSEESYVFIFDETNKTFRIGVASEVSTGFLDSSTQAVATRQDSPIANGIAVWNNIQNRFDTFTKLTFDGSILTLDGSLHLTAYAGASDLMLVVAPDGTVKTLAITKDTSVLGAINIGDSSGHIYAGLTADGSLQFKGIIGAGAAIITETADLITISLDGSFGGEINTASNILGGDASIFLKKSAQDLQFRAFKSQDPASLIITNDASFVYFDLSIGPFASDASINDLYTYIDGSLLLRDSKISDLDASIVILRGWQVDQDASITGIRSHLADTDASFAAIRSKDADQDASIVALRNKDLDQDASIVILRGWQIDQDASITGIRSHLADTDASIVSLDGRLDLAEASLFFLDSSIKQLFAIEPSLYGLSDVSIIEPLITHQVIEYDASASKWVNTDNIWWDSSLGTTSDDLGGIPAGTNLNGLTLKEILYRILYEYQLPLLSVGSNPVGGYYEKGLASTQFATVDVSYFASNANYPLAKLNSLWITKTGIGPHVLDVSLGLVDSSFGIYSDVTGITNWGGTNRTITYDVYLLDDQPGSASVHDQESFTFYYREHWGEVAGNTNIGQVTGVMIQALDSSRLAGESDLLATFDSSGGFIKYLFAYPDTVAAPDNFGLLSEIIDQNGFDITSSFETGNKDVSVGVNNVRYRFYLLKNKVDTSTFNITFKF